jgi:hypothetical protein
MPTNSEFEFLRLRGLAERTVEALQHVPPETGVVLVLEALIQVRKNVRLEIEERLAPLLKGE